MKHLFWSLSLIIFFSSCKSLKNTTTISNPEVKETIAVSKMALAHENAVFSNKTLEAKVEAQFDNGENTQDVNIKMRIEKDKIIWMSGNFLGIPMAKIMITPTRIQYYEKINKTFFDGDFSLFKQIFGVEMNFEQVQNLLLGQAFYNFKDGLIETETADHQYLLTPVIQNPNFDIFYLINSINYKLISQEAKLPNAQSLKVDYPKYQKIGMNYIPAQIRIESILPAQKTKIFLDISNIELDNSLTFPFSIPDGYKELNFEKLKK
jgi:hypothetical protein